MADENARHNALWSYACMKCGHGAFERQQLRASAGFWSSLFNLQNRRYTAIVCRRCRFTELFHGETPAGQQVADLLLGR